MGLDFQWHSHHAPMMENTHSEVSSTSTAAWQEDIRIGRYVSCRRPTRLAKGYLKSAELILQKANSDFAKIIMERLSSFSPGAGRLDWNVKTPSLWCTLYISLKTVLGRRALINHAILAKGPVSVWVLWRRIVTRVWIRRLADKCIKELMSAPRANWSSNLFATSQNQIFPKSEADFSSATI